MMLKRAIVRRVFFLPRTIGSSLGFPRMTGGPGISGGGLSERAAGDRLAEVSRGFHSQFSREDGSLAGSRKPTGSRGVGSLISLSMNQREASL